MEVGKISHVDTSRGSYGGSLVGVALGLNSVSCVARSSAATSHIPNAQSGQYLLDRRRALPYPANSGVDWFSLDMYAIGLASRKAQGIPDLWCHRRPGVELGADGPP